MKKLFTVIDKRGHPQHFTSKIGAKDYRDDYELKCVSKGPDHIGNHGNGRKAWKPNRHGT